MRMTLAEIALGLGCGPDSVVWTGNFGGAGSAPSPRASAAVSLKALSRSRSAAQGDPREQGAFRGEAAWLGAPWAGDIPSGCRTDSREVRPGDLFFCLKGERVDGHDYALDAAKAGASAIVAERNPFWGVLEDSGGTVPPPVFLVEDSVKSLGRLAVCHRDTSLARVVGVTGTSGKTTVKEVLAQVLAMRGQTARTIMNHNNQIGLPRSMLNASADASFWVMEMGISEAGDMDELGAILRPDVALILNVGEGHLQGLGDKGVAHYKARLLDHIMPGGCAVVSADYPELSREVDARKDMLEARGIEIIRFSASARGCYYRAEYTGKDSSSSGLYRAYLGPRFLEVRTPFLGGFGEENVAAIVAVADKLGLVNAEIERGFSRAVLPDQRFACHTYGRFTVVDDSYNANPLSAMRMLSAARALAGEAGIPLILVMGEMLELGAQAEKAHRELGGHMAGALPELVFWKGGHARAVREGLLAGGYAGRFYPVSSGQDFSILLEESGLTEGVVLFKGSRGNHLERLVDTFRECVLPPGDRNAV